MTAFSLQSCPVAGSLVHFSVYILAAPGFQLSWALSSLDYCHRFQALSNTFAITQATANQPSSSETAFGIALPCQIPGAGFETLFPFYFVFCIQVKHAPKTAKTVQKNFASQTMFSLQLKNFCTAWPGRLKLVQPKVEPRSPELWHQGLVAASLALCNEKPYSRWYHVSDVLRQWSLMSIIAI